MADHLTKIMESPTWEVFIQTGKITVPPAKYNRAEARQAREKERELEIQRRKDLGITTEKVNIVKEWISKTLGVKFTLSEADIEPVEFEEEPFTGVGENATEEDTEAAVGF